MLRKGLIFCIIISFLASQTLFLPRTTAAGTEELANELRITPKERLVPKEEGYEKITCPSCRRSFEIKVDPNDLEFQRGIKKMVCPYDGTEFYPSTAARNQEELEYETVKCPTCGKEFKAYIDVKALLAGDSQVLVCPYDKGKFYFKAEGFKRGELKRANLVTVMCPTDKRTFKAYIDPENAKELTCPYDGTR